MKIENSDRMCVSRTELPEILGCGQYTADKISRRSGARIKVGKRVLVYLPRLEAYLKEITD